MVVIMYQGGTILWMVNSSQVILSGWTLWWINNASTTLACWQLNIGTGAYFIGKILVGKIFMINCDLSNLPIFSPSNISPLNYIIQLITFSSLSTVGHIMYILVLWCTVHMHAVYVIYVHNYTYGPRVT